MILIFFFVANRGDGPTVFAQVKNGVAMDEIISLILGEWRASGAAKESS